MSLYHQKLKIQITVLNIAIADNNDSIKILKEELNTGNNVYSRRAHEGRIEYLTFHNFALKTRLEKVKRSIF